MGVGEGELRYGHAVDVEAGRPLHTRPQRGQGVHGLAPPVGQANVMQQVRSCPEKNVMLIKETIVLLSLFLTVLIADTGYLVVHQTYKTTKHFQI